MLTQSPPGIREPGSNGHDLLWIETRPLEKGRYVLVTRTESGQRDVTPAPFNVRNRVHEYGGGSWAAEGDLVVFSHFEDNRLYRIDGPGETPRAITPEGPFRYADLQLDARHNRIVAVREDHGIADTEPVNTMVVLDLDGPNARGGTVIVSGSDFVASPRLDRDGTKLAWLSWNHPNMPWDATVLSWATLTTDGTIGDVHVVADGERESAILHGWDRQGRLTFVSDRTGWWHLYRIDDAGQQIQLTQGEAEYGVPLWQFGASTWTELVDGTIVTLWTERGTWHLGTLTGQPGEVTPINLPFTTMSDLHAHPDGTRVVLKAASPQEPAALITVDPASGAWERVTAPTTDRLDGRYTAIAKPVSWPTPDGATAHGFYYPPTNRDVVAPSNELPPLIVESHGGPTSATTSTFDLEVQFWTSRGFAVLDVNYGGSTGYGRAYRERLNGAWGVVDVDDCASGALALADRGLVDRDRLIIRGGSAGGFTTLAALAFRDVFSAGASYYGIGDLEAMAADTHKFESRYLDSLVGPYPEAITTYHERSAIHHVDRLDRPMILFQGLDDKVVPPAQSVSMADAVRAKGLPVALLTFEGEGHGFRMAETIERTLLAELSFYGQVFGFEPAGDVPRLPIDNLPVR
jgi:dipeptidyl aminopeptidase/acylaminoacyl peptidase